MNCLSRMAGAFLLLLCPQLQGAARSAEFTEVAGAAVPTILMRGPVVAGDYDRFSRAAGGRERLVLELESDGGSVAEAVHIGQRVRAAGYETSVRRGSCASACALIWISGSKMHYGPGARIGFHGPYVAGTDPKTGRPVAYIIPRADAEYAIFMRWLGVDPALERFTLAVPPNDMAFLSPFDAVVLGLPVFRDGRPLGRRLRTPEPADAACFSREYDLGDEASVASCVIADVARARETGASPDYAGRKALLKSVGLSDSLTYAAIARYESMVSASGRRPAPAARGR